jgi:transketolase
VALERLDGPTAIVLTRQDVPVLDRDRFAPASGLASGAYVLGEIGLPPTRVPDTAPDLILIATGSEVTLAVSAAEILAADGIRCRVVSMPSWELFAAQSEAYRNEVLPPSVRVRLGIEAASPFGWLRWTTDDGAMLAMEGFGASAPAERLFQEFEFTPERAAEMVRRLLARRHTPGGSEGS